MNNSCSKRQISSSIIWAASIIATALLGGSAFLSIVLLPALAACHILYIQKQVKTNNKSNCH